ncbi:MAG: hypothetical protein C0608_00070 [Deltaproteobacteria bacterium]|nr:MAG: hypothetical protein C0608_00070 [Deltaproteobacteria bacterium]
MSQLPDIKSPETEKEWVEVARPPAPKAREWALVLNARGVPHRLRHIGRIVVISVMQVDLERAERELKLYEDENSEWPPIYETTKPRGDEFLISVVLFGALAVLLDLSQGSFSYIVEAGRVSAAKMLWEGQWWRSVTALTLHANFRHLGGNALVGVFFLSWLIKDAGAGFGLLLFFAAGAAGNILTVIYEGMPHISVGSSTALFGTIGVLSAFAVLRRRDMPWRRWILPLGAGAALLAMLGGPGERVDFTAHIMGLGAGFLLGLPTGKLLERHAAWALISQLLAGVGAIAIVAISWALALS